MTSDIPDLFDDAPVDDPEAVNAFFERFNQTSFLGSRQVCVRPACGGFLDCGAGVYPSKTRDLSHVA